MSQNGKGSRQRPRNVDQKTWDKNYNRIFRTKTDDLRTIFTRIQRAETIEALREFGIILTDTEGKFVGAYKAMELLSKGLSQLDPRDVRFSKIVEELVGFRQISKIIPLIQQFATAQEELAKKDNKSKS